MPQPGSVLVDAAVAGPLAVPVEWQLDASGRSQPRSVRGAAADLGATEQ